MSWNIGKIEHEALDINNYYQIKVGDKAFQRFLKAKSVIVNYNPETEKVIGALRDDFVHAPIIFRSNRQLAVLKFVFDMLITPDNKYLVISLGNELDKQDYLSALMELYTYDQTLSECTFLNNDRTCWKINSKGSPEYTGIWS